MRLFVKLKNIEELDEGQQNKLISKYITKYCKTSEKEIKLDMFISHVQQKTISFKKTFSIGVYSVDKLYAEQVYTKLLGSDVYDILDVFILL